MFTFSALVNKTRSICNHQLIMIKVSECSVSKGSTIAKMWTNGYPFQPSWISFSLIDSRF